MFACDKSVVLCGRICGSCFLDKSKCVLIYVCIVELIPNRGVYRMDIICKGRLTALICILPCSLFIVCLNAINAVKIH